MTELPFFASKVRLGRAGIEEIYSLGPLNEYERFVIIFHFGFPCSLFLANLISYCMSKFEGTVY